MADNECTPVWRKLLICGPETGGLAAGAVNADEYMTEPERREALAAMTDYLDTMHRLFSTRRKSLATCGPLVAALAQASVNIGESLTDAEREEFVQPMIAFEEKMAPFLTKWTGYPPLKK